jgi:hypothetical protein
MSFWTWDSCIVVSSITLVAVMVFAAGGVDMAMFSSSVYIRVSTAAFSSAVSSLDTECT